MQCLRLAPSASVRLKLSINLCTKPSCIFRYSIPLYCICFHEQEPVHQRLKAFMKTSCFLFFFKTKNNDKSTITILLSSGKILTFPPVFYMPTFSAIPSSLSACFKPCPPVFRLISARFLLVFRLFSTLRIARCLSYQSRNMFNHALPAVLTTGSLHKPRL